MGIISSPQETKEKMARKKDKLTHSNKIYKIHCNLGTGHSATRKGRCRLLAEHRVTSSHWIGQEGCDV
jgi:hypothetical protein